MDEASGAYGSERVFHHGDPRRMVHHGSAIPALACQGNSRVGGNSGFLHISPILKQIEYHKLKSGQCASSLDGAAYYGYARF